MSRIGYIKLYRAIVDNDIYVLPPLYLRVFERLIMEANHQDKEIPYKKNGIVTVKNIKRGERLTSIRQISRWVGWYERGIFKEPNPKLIKEILDYLIKDNMIEICGEGNRTETLYKIVNYEVYQDKEDTKVTEQKQKRNEVETDLKRLAPTNNNDKEGLKTNKNDNNDLIISIVEYLNRKAEAKYKADSKKTKSVIEAKLNEKYTLENFKTVIDKKVTEWKGTEWERFLRPETLFGTKFEGYLNQNIISKKEKDKPSYQNYKQKEYDIKSLEDKLRFGEE